MNYQLSIHKTALKRPKPERAAANAEEEAQAQAPLSEFGTANNAPHNGVARPIHRRSPLSPFFIKPPPRHVFNFALLKSGFK